MNRVWLVLYMLFTLCKVSFTSFQRNRTSRSVPESRELICEPEWYPFGDSCYKIGASKKTGYQPWEKAKQTCNALGGNLVAIHSKELHDFLQIFLQEKIKSHVWIGLNDHEKEGEWKWEDCSPTDFLNWDDNEPNLNDHEEDCVIMYYEGQHRIKEHGVWHDWDCAGDSSFICQKKKMIRLSTQVTPPDPRFCPDGGFEYENSCFHLIKAPKSSWSEAEEYCGHYHGGHLAKILDESTNRFIRFVFGNDVPRSWIGIKMNSDQFQQKWSSGWLVSYERWNGNMIGCSTLESSGDWSFIQCTAKLPFICEVSIDSPPSLTPAPEGSYCPKIPKGWRDLGGEKCYFLETENLVSWKEANFRCLRMGGVLASIHSQNESEILFSFGRRAKHALYIGLHRSSLHEDDFVWSDGSPMDYTSWNINEPNSSGEQCGELIRGTIFWNDIDCNAERGFVCSIVKLSEYGNSESEKSCMRLCGYLTRPLSTREKQQNGLKPAGTSPRQQWWSELSELVGAPVFGQG